MNDRMRMTVVGPGEIALRCSDCGHPDCKTQGQHAVECHGCPSLCGRWRPDKKRYLCEQCFSGVPLSVDLTRLV